MCVPLRTRLDPGWDELQPPINRQGICLPTRDQLLSLDIS
jgi:hypothetical protein